MNSDEAQWFMKTCFGTIYPDLEKFQFQQSLIGKVFRIEIDTVDGGLRNRKLKIDLEEWHNCAVCQDFGNCYDFSTAKLHMQRVLREL